MTRTWISGFVAGALTVGVIACGGRDCSIPAAPIPDERSGESHPVDRCNQPLGTGTNGEEAR